MSIDKRKKSTIIIKIIGLILMQIIIMEPFVWADIEPESLLSPSIHISANIFQSIYIDMQDAFPRHQEQQGLSVES